MALNEALQQLNSTSGSSSPSLKEEWVSTITQLLGGIRLCFSEEPQLLSSVPRCSSMARLANNLIQVRRSPFSEGLVVLRALEGRLRSQVQISHLLYVALDGLLNEDN